MIKVNNCNFAIEEAYCVVRDCGNESYWFWGSYNNFVRALGVAKEIKNGIVIPTKEIERI